MIVTSALGDAAFNRDRPGSYRCCERIVRRKHFKVLYQRNPTDIKINLEAGEPSTVPGQNDSMRHYFDTTGTPKKEERWISQFRCEMAGLNPRWRFRRH